MNQLKRRVYKIIEKSTEGDNVSRYFDLFIVALILFNTLAIVLESYDSIYRTYKTSFYVFEVVSVILFTLEYTLRFWTSDMKYPNLGKLRARTKYSISGMALIDLFAILPFYLPMIFPFDLRFLRMVRITRLMRVLKINRYSKALIKIQRVMAKKKEELLATVFVMTFVIVIAATLMYYFETEVQPEAFPNIVASLWWAVATLTTVGYGDIYPITFVGKLLASIIAISGIGLVALPTGIISSGFVDEIKTQEDMPSCQECPYKINQMHEEKRVESK